MHETSHINTNLLRSLGTAVCHLVYYLYEIWWREKISLPEKLPNFLWILRSHFLIQQKFQNLWKSAMVFIIKITKLAMISPTSFSSNFLKKKSSKLIFKYLHKDISLIPCDILDKKKCTCYSKVAKFRLWWHLFLQFCITYFYSSIF